MEVAEDMRTKLTAALAPAKLTIIDESDRHAGHAGSRPEGETHFQVVVIASAFEGKSRLERQRMIYGVRFLSMFRIGDASLKSARQYPRLTDELRRADQLTGISQADLWIAAWALQHMR